MKLTLAAVFLAVVSVSNAIDIPQIPALPTLPPEVLSALPAEVQTAIPQLVALIGQINPQIATVVPLLATAGTEGPNIISGITNLVGTLSNIDPTELLAVPKGALAAYDVLDPLCKLIDSAAGLNIKELTDIAGPLNTLKTTLGIIRCPANPIVCLPVKLPEIPFGK